MQQSYQFVRLFCVKIDGCRYFVRFSQNKQNFACSSLSPFCILLFRKIPTTLIIAAKQAVCMQSHCLLQVRVSHETSKNPNAYMQTLASSDVGILLRANRQPAGRDYLMPQPRLAKITHCPGTSTHRPECCQCADRRVSVF